MLEFTGSDRPSTAQALSRANNNLGAALQTRDPDAAATSYRRAIDLYESLVTRVPENREYQLELAQFSNNLAAFLAQKDPGDAEVRNSRAIALLKDRARPAPSLGIEIADAYNLRGGPVHSKQPDEAEQSFKESLDRFVDLSSVATLLRLPALHNRFGDLLINLAWLAQGKVPGAPDRIVQAATRLLDRAIGAVR